MEDHLERVSHYKGTPYEIGLAAGRRLGNRLEETIRHYISSLEHSKDMQRVHAGALPWLRRLPRRFQDELEGMAEGTGVPLEFLAEWSYIEEYEAEQCSGAVLLQQGRPWVARNNDLYVPELWGYATIREVEGRIPTISFTMEGDVFTPTGVNKERLWLHYNFLPVWDRPAPNKPHVPAFAFLTEALEICHTIRDVEVLLSETDRDGGMLLFAVDGKTDEFAVFDCMCSAHYRRQPSDGWIIGTNHYCAVEDRTLDARDELPGGSVSRYRRMETLIHELSTSQAAANLPGDLIRILADDGVERRGEEVVTVYSNVACPGTGEIWYTFGGYPAASKGNWQRVEWPWND